MEHSIDEKIELICREYLTSLADMRDLTAQMEMVSRAEFKNPLETILYANGTKVLGREILRLVIHCSRHEASVWVSCYVGKLQPLNEEG